MVHRAQLPAYICLKAAPGRENLGISALLGTSIALPRAYQSHCFRPKTTCVALLVAIDMGCSAPYGRRRKFGQSG
jgi:hypothetical protein